MRPAAPLARPAVFWWGVWQLRGEVGPQTVSLHARRAVWRSPIRPATKCQASRGATNTTAGMTALG
jgi:hypothetical protein